MARKYIIYRIEGPTGRAYVGLTGQTLKERWRQHVIRSTKPGRHPLYDSIRKYGADKFKVEVLAMADGLENTKATEIFCIAQEDRSYNLLPGGECGSEPSRIFWRRIKSDPTAYAAYREKLCAAQRLRTENGGTREHLQIHGKKWREDNPREAYKISARGLRVALKKNTTKGINAEERRKQAEKPLKERLLEKHKGIYLSRSRGVAGVWKGRDKQTAEAIGANISQGLTRYHAENPGKVNPQLAEARKSIDRSIQGPAASRGVKKFWEELKKDTPRYKEYMDKRTASLMRTICKQKPTISCTRGLETVSEQTEE